MKTTNVNIKVKTIFTILCTIPLLFALTTQTSAEILASRATTYLQGFGTENLLIDWDHELDPSDSLGGGRTIYFDTDEPNTRVAITFSASCEVAYDNPTKYVGIDILLNPSGPVDAFAVSPSGSGNALCSGRPHNGGGLQKGVHAVVQTTAVIAQPGIHSVQVRVRTEGAAGFLSILLDDMSLVVQR